MRNVFRSLNQIYYLIYTLIILMTVSGYFLNLNELLTIKLTESKELLLLITQSVLTLAAVVIFLLFILNSDKIGKIDERKQRALKYYKLARLRLLSIGLSLFVGVVSLYLIRSEVAIYQIAVSAILLLVSKPVEAKIDELLT